MHCLGLSLQLHRAIFGSLERFFGVMIESTAGDFPFWIAPVQLRLLPVSDDFRPYCEEVAARAKQAGLRVEIDQGGRSVGKQIKVANQDKLPCYAVVGAREVDERTLSITCRKEGLDGVELVSVGALAYEQTINQMEVASKSGAAAVDVLLVGGGEAA